jgi:hypothetical protein
MADNRPGKCGYKGCAEPRHQSKSGKYYAYCHAHVNARGRAATVKHGGEFVPVPRLPSNVRIIVRRCLQCGQKCPGVAPYFDTSRDTATHLYMVCGLCDGSAAAAGVASLFLPRNAEVSA